MDDARQLHRLLPLFATAVYMHSLPRVPSYHKVSSFTFLLPSCTRLLVCPQQLLLGQLSSPLSASPSNRCSFPIYSFYHKVSSFAFLLPSCTYISNLSFTPLLPVSSTTFSDSTKLGSGEDMDKVVTSSPMANTPSLPLSNFDHSNWLATLPRVSKLKAMQYYWGLYSKPRLIARTGESWDPPSSLGAYPQRIKVGTSTGRGCPVGTRPGYHPQVQHGSGAVGNGSVGVFTQAGMGRGSTYL